MYCLVSNISQPPAFCKKISRHFHDLSMASRLFKRHMTALARRQTERKKKKNKKIVFTPSLSTSQPTFTFLIFNRLLSLFHLPSLALCLSERELKEKLNCVANCCRPLRFRVNQLFILLRQQATYSYELGSKDGSRGGTLLPSRG